MHANTTLTPTPIDICTDCLFVLANGAEDDAQTAAAERLADRWPGESPVTTPAVTLGRMDGAETEPSFSWQPCEGCGSRLGGDRHPATGWYRGGDAA